MSVNCSVCSDVCVDDSTTLKCASNCGNTCHLNCAPQKTRGSKKEWFCDTCKSEKSSSLASNKSATMSSISKEFLINTLDAFKQEMLAEFQNHTAESTELRNSLSFLSDAIDKNNAIMDRVMSELKKTQEENSTLRQENIQLRSSVNNLEVRLRNLEQHSRRQNIEIDGLPETQGEDVNTILRDVARSIGVEMKSEQLVAAHRVPSFNKKRTPPIIVRFATYEARDGWIAGFKRVRPLTANRINANFNGSSKVFINEHLSPENKQLLAKTKEAARAKNYKYVWSREGKVFVRRVDGERCIRVDAVSDLEKL